MFVISRNKSTTFYLFYLLIIIYLFIYLWFRGLPATPRVCAVCKAVPLCLDILFREALEAPHAKPRSIEP